MYLSSSIDAIRQVLVDDQGATVVEYALLVALVAALLLFSLLAGIGNSLVSFFEAADAGLQVDLPEN